MTVCTILRALGIEAEYCSDLVQQRKKFSISSGILQCSRMREMWSDFSAISGNLREFAQLQMKKEKERRGLFGQKKRESSIIRILKKREEKEGDGFFVTPLSSYCNFVDRKTLFQTRSLCRQHLESRRLHCESHVTTAQSLMKLEVFFQTAEQLW